MTNRITTAGSAAEWLGNDAYTPSGEAWRAVQEGKHDTLEAILESHGQAACGTAQGPVGHPVRALSCAARMGDTLAMTMLIKAGADVNARSDGNMIASPLQWTIEANSLAGIRILVQNGAEVNPEHENLARHAVQYGDPVQHPHNTVLEALLSSGTKAGPDALVMALERRSPQWAAQLLDAGVDPNAHDTRPGGRQPLEVVIQLRPQNAGAADASSTAMRSLQVLLDAKVDVNAELGPKNMYCRPPLLAAVEAGAGWAIRNLLDAGARPAETLDRIARNGIRNRDDGCRGIANAMQRLLAAKSTPRR